MFTIKEIVERDYRASLDFIDKIDDQLFKIRNWTIVTITAIIAFSHHQQNSYISLFGIFIAIFFMYLELVYKCLQDDVIHKTRDIDTRIENELNHNSENQWSDYKVGMGKALKRPSIFRIFREIFTLDKWHIVTIYVMAMFASYVSYYSLTGRFW